jgi:hypothetical protein
MKRWLTFVWEVLHEIGQARARQRLNYRSWDY